MTNHDDLLSITGIAKSQENPNPVQPQKSGPEIHAVRLSEINKTRKRKQYVKEPNRNVSRR